MTTKRRDQAEQGVGTAAGGLLANAPHWVWNVVAYAPTAAWVGAGALGVAALAGRGPRLLRQRGWLGGILAVGAAAGLLRSQLQRFFTEQPAYEVEAVRGGLEVRRYQPRVVAETTVAGTDWDDGIDEGFRRLAGYIFGANRGRQTIAMTAPVNAVPARRERLAMTAPVTARPVPAGDGLTVTFTMPSARSLASLPAPNDHRVLLRTEPGGRVAALRYRGSYGGRRIEEMKAELLRRVRAAGLAAAGPAVFAGYDPPSTLPVLRRLEVWVPLA